MDVKLTILPGDGIGPEVVSAAIAVLDVLGRKFGHNFNKTERLIGGCAIDACGTALPEETLGDCLSSDAVLLGAVGGPKWDDPTARIRPEQGLLGIRKAMGLFANLRPLKIFPDLINASPLRPERLAGVDLLVVRELTGGIYFGTPRERRELNGEIQAVDTMVYSQHEIRRVTHLAFKAAQNRRGKVTSVDKANVLETSRLWRQTVNEVAADYPDVELEHLLVDAAAMHLLSRPSSFDVIVTENMFGDILTDEASMLSGSLGNLPSASLGGETNTYGHPRGLYEPIHGSAPDIAGKGVANPVGTILSLAMLLRHSLGMESEAEAVETAVQKALSSGYRTGDIARNGETSVSTQTMTEAIIHQLT